VKRNSIYHECASAKEDIITVMGILEAATVHGVICFRLPVYVYVTVLSFLLHHSILFLPSSMKPIFVALRLRDRLSWALGLVMN
jgi:hypothetical protein